MPSPALLFGEKTMEVGDHVRLRKSFQPIAGGQTYTNAVIAGLVRDDSHLTQHSTIVEVIVHLYDPQTGSIYTDDAGEPVLYSFYLQEIIGS
jgi:hypothetical protein